MRVMLIADTRVTMCKCARFIAPLLETESYNS